MRRLIPTLAASVASTVLLTAGLAAPAAFANAPVTTYNSLIPGTGDPYVQDQTFGGAGVTEFGNEVNLSHAGLLSHAVVAMHNWGAATSVPITLTVYNPAASLSSAESSGPGSVIGSVTQTFNFPANNTDGSPSLTNIDFGSSLASAGIVVPKTVVFGISYNPFGPGASVNVALSTSTSGTSYEGIPASSNITAGSDVYPGTVFVNISPAFGDGGWQVDTGTCSNPEPGIFEATNVWCGTGSSGPTAGPNGPPYAYVGPGNPDIPAMQFTTSISQDQCKNGGWQSLTDANGTAFKNQGDCVSYVATGGRNSAAG